MGRGIKMRSARDRHGMLYTVESLQALHDRHQTAPDLICDHPPCGCAVRFVPRYQQNRANRIEPIDVPAYIGLTGDSEHMAGCCYDAPGRLTAIVAQSDPDFMKALDGGKRELRLLALHNGLGGRGLSGHLPPAGGINPAANPPGRNRTTSYTQTEEKLSSYLRTTADLVALRAVCEEDALLAAELTLRFGTKRIPWSQFFFEQERYDEAWELVRAGGDNSHPIALAGVVKSHHSPAPGAKYRSSFLNCASLYCRTDDADRLDAFEVSVRCTSADWLTPFPVGTHVVMFGIWKSGEATEVQGKNSRDPSRPITYVTHKLTLSPKFRRQVVDAA